ncbi:MAG: hypothetical protein OEW62_01880 [Candidatus Bathyarchaeota archaeon]|nr:hypothetical protein [Candidatus Bathyarchaeota archaeon]
MNLKEYRTLFALVGIGLILITTFAFFSTVFPYPVTAERFFVLGLLGRDKTAENYYPNDDPNIRGFEKVRWYVFVQNFMLEAQYVLVKVKVLNSTMTLPDAVACTPSPEQAIMNLSVFLTNGQSSTIPFSWYLTNYSLHGESLIIERLVTNGISISLNVGAVNGSNFRLIFEVWYYDPAIEEFRFEWDSSFGLRCAWNQMLFNVAVEQ